MDMNEDYGLQVIQYYTIQVYSTVLYILKESIVSRNPCTGDRYVNSMSKFRLDYKNVIKQNFL